MGSDVLLLYGRAGSRGGGGVPRDEALDGVAGERAAGLGGEQRPGGIGAELGEPGPHDLDGLGGEGGGPVLAALAVAADVRPGPEVDVLALQAGELGDPQAGLDVEQEQCPVAAAVPGLAAGGRDQRVDLLGGEVADDRPLAAPRRDRQDLADHGGVLRRLRGRVLEQRVDRGQAGVACGAAVPPLVFQVVKERAHQGRVQVGEAEPAGRLASLVAGKGEQEPECVAVGGDGIRAGLLLPGQPVGEEALQDGSEVGHDAACPSCPVGSSLAAARPRSSGTAERYQYVDFGSACPSQVDRTGRRAWTSPPSRYQSSSVETVKTCRRSCSRGARCPGGALMTAAATSTANV